jgi:hypothetical protein
MDERYGNEALAPLLRVQSTLQAEVTKLLKQRQGLKAQLEGVDKELEAKQRMLRLVEATAQDLGRQQGGLDESGQDHLSVEASTEVRGRCL